MNFQTYKKYLNAGSENEKKRTIFSSVFFRLGDFYCIMFASLPRPSRTRWRLRPVSSSLGIAKVNFVSALAHSSTLIEGELNVSTS